MPRVTKKTNIENLLPEAFGPGSWVGAGEKLIRVYRRVRWHRDERLDPGESTPPLDLEDPTDTEIIPPQCRELLPVG